MNEKDIKISIKKFINLVLDKYDNIFIAFEYSAISECYEIWHNQEYLEYEDTEFKKFTGKLLYDLFLSKGIYNVYISYDYEKSMNLLLMESITSFEPGPIIQDYRIWDNRYDKIVFNEDSKNTENWIETSSNTSYSCENLPLHFKNISETNKIVVNNTNLGKFEENLKAKNENFKLAA
ncbi:MAG: hypothetical protein HQ534_09795 [Armatimonadetes bacterium]|nr:hypothetical protein [Armatimonadota bacterium]